MGKIFSLLKFTRPAQFTGEMETHVGVEIPSEFNHKGYSPLRNNRVNNYIALGTRFTNVIEDSIEVVGEVETMDDMHRIVSLKVWGNVEGVLK